MREVQVNVTEKHIKNGIRFNARNCPLALAIRDCGFNQVGIGAFTFYIDGESGNLPEDMIKFRQNYDNKNEVFPTTFKLILRKDH